MVSGMGPSGLAGVDWARPRGHGRTRDRPRRGEPGRAGLVRAGLLVGLVLATTSPGCSDESPTAGATPVPEPPTDPARSGKVDPAPHSMRALGRAVFDALERDDWDGYTNVLAARADLMAVFRDVDRGDRRERRRRRRMVWRRINRLRDGGAEKGWKAVRREAKRAGVAWDTARLVDVRHAPSTSDHLPADATTAHLRLVVEHRQVQQGIDLGPCVRTPRGWVVLYPMQWLGEGHGEPFGESLMDPAPEP